MSDAFPYNRMSARELKELLKARKISQRELGRWLEKDERTARRYVLGESKVSPELAILMRLLDDRPELIAYVRSRVGEAEDTKL